MAIDAGDLKKIDVDLTEITNKAMTYYFPCATGGNTPVRMSGNTLLRSLYKYENTEAGAAGDVSFSLYDHREITISEDFACTLQNVPEGSTNWLTVNKGATHVITFANATAVSESKQQGETKLIYRIIGIDSEIHVERVNRQFSGSLAGTDLTSTFGSITSFGYFNWQIEGEICTFEGSFTYDPIGTGSGTIISITNFDVVKANSGYSAINVHLTSGATVFTPQARLKEDTLTLNFGVSTGDPVEVLISGSFKIT